MVRLTKNLQTDLEIIASGTSDCGEMFEEKEEKKLQYIFISTELHTFNFDLVEILL